LEVRFGRKRRFTPITIRRVPPLFKRNQLELDALEFGFIAVDDLFA